LEDYRFFKSRSLIKWSLFEESTMPTYEYRCANCGKRFSVVESISKHEASRRKCPKCKSVKVSQVLSQFFAKTGKKS